MLAAALNQPAVSPTVNSERRLGGFATGTLNYLVGEDPVRQWVDALLEEERLLERLKKVTQDRATHELVLRAAGVPRSTLEAALEAAQSEKPVSSGTGTESPVRAG